METAAPAGFVVPNPRIPKVLGVLNIVFASALLILGLCTAASRLLTPALMSMAKEAQKKNADVAEAVRRQQLKDLEAAEKSAEAEDQRQEIRDQRKAAETANADPTAALMDPAQMGFSDRRLQAWYVIEFLSGILLNVLMLASGIGLVQFRPWGRSLGIWTAGAKVVRLESSTSASSRQPRNSSTDSSPGLVLFPSREISSGWQLADDSTGVKKVAFEVLVRH